MRRAAYFVIGLLIACNASLVIANIAQAHVADARANAARAAVV